MLDLAAGSYDATDEVGAEMWTQLLLAPKARDLPGLAERYGVDPSVIDADLAEFARAQLEAGRLVAEEPRDDAPPPVPAPRRRPTTAVALWERARTDRDLRRGFADAYASRTGPRADTSPPRADAAVVLRRFSTADGLYPAPEAPQDCLPRSLALTRFLRTSGWHAHHVIGVALYPFEAHAWVELDGDAIQEGTTYLQRFTVIQRA